MSDVALKLVAEPCDACPFVGRFDLSAGRLRDIVAECRRTDSLFVCHKTVDYDDDERGSDVALGPAAVCAGWRRVGHVPSVLQVAERLGWTREVAPT